MHGTHEHGTMMINACEYWLVSYIRINVFGHKATVIWCNQLEFIHHYYKHVPMPSFEDPLNIKEKYFFGLAEKSHCIYLYILSNITKGKHSKIIKNSL